MNWYRREKLAGLRAYNMKDFLKILDRFGVEFIRQAKGSHGIWGIPSTGRQTAIPMAHRTINPETMKKIVNQLGIPFSEFKQGNPSIQETENNYNETETTPEWQNQPWHQEQLQYS